MDFLLAEIERKQKQIAENEITSVSEKTLFLFAQNTACDCMILGLVIQFYQ